jgi:hypothetical protein
VLQLSVAKEIERAVEQAEHFLHHVAEHQEIDKGELTKGKRVKR